MKHKLGQGEKKKTKGKANCESEQLQIRADLKLFQDWENKGGGRKFPKFSLPAFWSGIKKDLDEQNTLVGEKSNFSHK